ncbi:calcium-binding protein [Polaromonas sp.]|uniref:calcium-binding protein n=1 Tax=Polaromonas sp. TaxID=1869339 RepID=UPI001A1E89E9|nr:calcium-binding protein [Burkholderiales bacterium]
MKRTPVRPDRKNRIAFEIVVEACDQAERAMGWYCYLQDQLQVPFKATCRSARSTSPLEVGVEVEVVGLAREDDCMAEIFVLVRYAKSQLAVPLEQLACHALDKQTCQAVADWHYGVARGYDY